MRPAPIRLRDRSGEGQPVVTIVTPCFNHGHYLPDGLETVLDQQYPAIESLIVDDGSDDPHTLGVIAELETDERFKIVRHDRNRGLAAALNTGVSHATGRYVLPFDADNRLLPDAVADLVAQINEADPSIGFIYPNVQFFGNRHDYYTPPAYNLFSLLQGNYCDSCSLIDRDVFDHGARYLGGLFREDWHLWLELAKREVYGERARTKTFMFRKRGFNRSDLVGHAKVGQELDGPTLDRHPEFYGSPRAYAAVKADWRPAASVVALNPLRDAAGRSALAAAIERQTCIDAEFLLREETEQRAVDGPCVRGFGAGLAAALETARGRFVVVTDGTGAELFADVAFLEKLLRAFTAGPSLQAVAFVEGAELSFPWQLLEPAATGEAAPHTVAWSTDRLGDLRQAVDVGPGRPAAAIAAVLRERSAVQWRVLPGPEPGAPLEQAVAVRFSARRAYEGGLNFQEARLAATPLLPILPPEHHRRPRTMPWRPPQSRPIFRHVNVETGLRLATDNGNPPPGCRLERRLGWVKIRHLPGTLRLDAEGGGLDPDVSFHAREELSPDHGARNLGFVETAALPMFARLAVGVLPRTGQRVLVSGRDDPLVSQLTDVSHLGWIEPSPIAPATVHPANVAPAAPAAADRSAGELALLLRGLDEGGKRHRYGVGELTGATLVGELGGLLVEPGNGRRAVWLSEAGMLYTEGYRPRRRRPSTREALHWTLSPLRWRGYGRWPSRADEVLRRSGQWLRHLVAPTDPRVPVEPVGPATAYLHASSGPGRAALFAATHPVVGDQLLTVWAEEAFKLGYDEPVLLGYVSAATDEAGTPVAPSFRSVPLPWAWQLGRPAQRVRATTLGAAANGATASSVEGEPTAPPAPVPASSGTHLSD